MPLHDHTLLEAALVGLEAQKARIEAQIREVRARLGRRGPGRPPKSFHQIDVAARTEEFSKPNAPGRRKMSAEGRARIAEAQRRRWAAAKKT